MIRTDDSDVFHRFLDLPYFPRRIPVLGGCVRQQQIDQQRMVEVLLRYLRPAHPHRVARGGRGRL